MCRWYRKNKESVKIRKGRRQGHCDIMRVGSSRRHRGGGQGQGGSQTPCMDGALDVIRGAKAAKVNQVED